MSNLAFRTISLRTAAGLLGMSRVELQGQFKEKGILTRKCSIMLTFT